ncbi:CDP-alcohol phosphatidyltransferase [Cavenderia fasciculata]|uniref:CDP-alcohol phosphatidyltransferase n=1 Tax=Cavenderia fasciculata TaxID=261658 RepID=F4QEV5_CACFS|nr:CDP-alcohol phosphatidyltransferase [Cavenderia fasciculata]EGG14162.1 CDP-alcohol phosphatidyltransferase [Cavenderia fasciculata]|eukprot:XP_004350870.1 CDP-alcohol phosphatidyltransferase [Cavenderia fasciculata]
MSHYFKYISEKGIANLAHYHYSGVDNSWCGTHFLKYWWTYAVEHLTPLWLAKVNLINLLILFSFFTLYSPNLITLVGLLCNIGMYLIIYFHCPTLTEEAPRWCYLAVAFLIFAYQTLDNVDGKQARRTKSSSPLGELFDHVCDAISVAMFAVVMSATLRVGPKWAFISLFVGIWPFYLAHWEEYHAGILVMGEFNGPTEAQVLFMIIEIITCIFSSDIWIIGPKDFTIGMMATVAVSFGAIFTIYQNFKNTFALQNRIPFMKCLIQLTPFVIFNILIIIWVSVSDLLTTQPHLFIMTIGMVFAYLQSRYITQRVCHDDCLLFYPILVPFAIVVFNSILASFQSNLISEYAMLWVMFVLACIQFLIFAVFTTRQLCDHLRIKVFTITSGGGGGGGSAGQPSESQQSSLLSAVEEGAIEHEDDDNNNNK